MENTDVVKNAIIELHEINLRMKKLNDLYFDMCMEDMQMFMRAYEMLFIGRCDLSKEELQKAMVELIISRVGPDKFGRWVHDAGRSNREWDYLWKVNE